MPLVFNFSASSADFSVICVKGFVIRRNIYINQRVTLTKKYEGMIYMDKEGREKELKQEEEPLNVVPNFDNEAGFYWEDILGWFGGDLADYSNRVEDKKKEE
jgi:hypothetical protein